MAAVLVISRISMLALETVQSRLYSPTARLCSFHRVVHFYKKLVPAVQTAQSFSRANVRSNTALVTEFPPPFT